MRARQRASSSGNEPIHDPWSPVLIIGTEKAALCTRAQVADIVDEAETCRNAVHVVERNARLQQERVRIVLEAASRSEQDQASC